MILDLVQLVFQGYQLVNPKIIEILSIAGFMRQNF